MKTALRTLVLALLAVSVAFAQSPWTKQTSPNTTTTLRGLKVVNAQVVWASGTGGIIVRTVDGGTTWKLITAPDAANDFYAIDAVDSSTAWVLGTASGVTTTGAVKIWKTTNGGTSWTLQFQHADSYGDALKFFDANTGIFLGDPSQANKSRMVIARTTDGGTTWTQVPAASIPAVDSAADEVSTVNALEFVGNNAYFMTYGNSASIDPKVYKSTDKGLTWTTSPKVKLNNSTGISMKDDNTGMICNSNGKVAKTSNGWATADSSGPFGEVYGLRSVKWFAGTNVIYLVGGPSSTGFCGKSMDGGTTWTQVALPSGVARLRYMQFIDKTTGWAVGNSGSIVKWTGGDATVSEYINVTFRANAAAWRDTLKGTTGLVQLRGTTMTGTQSVDDGTTDTLSAGTIIDWNAKTTMYLTNVGGDYWQGTFKIKPGTKMSYKFFANAQNKAVKPGDGFEHNGWENNVVDVPGFYATNRGLDLTNVTKDTVLPLQFINGIGHGSMKQYDKPYTSKDTTYAFYVRVNMAGWEDFNPNNHKVAVRGSNMSDWGQTGELSWGPSYQLNREGTTSFYSNVIHVPNKYAKAGVAWKPVVHYIGNPLSEDWSAMVFNPNFQYEIPTTGIDTTIQWKWFNNLSPRPSANKDTLIVTFRANMQQAIGQRGFTIGDTLQVRSGYGSTAAEVRTKAMTRSGITTIYTATDTVIVTAGKLLHYQYYLVKSGTDVREIFYDFDWSGDIGQSERRKASVTGKTLTIGDESTSAFDMRRMPRFRNTSKLTKAVTVTYTVDVRPAYYTVKGGKKLISTNITPYTIGKADSVISWGVWMNGPAVGGWDTRGAWGSGRRADTTSKMYDDGTHGDLVKGDSVFSLTYAYTTSDFVGQEFKFGIGGFDNEGGFGNNHIENIDDAAATYTIASQFGSIDPKFYNAWNFDLKKPQTPTAIEDEKVVPLVYALNQNYPNPFNPSTVIRFTLPSDGMVTLKVFNALGQEMATVVNDAMKAGSYNVTFDASKLSTGVYFYQLNAGKFVDTKKMMLLK
jgi:hypothetical protein